MARQATYIDGLMVVIWSGDTDYNVSSDDSYLETDSLFVACTKTRGSVLFYPCYPCFFLVIFIARIQSSFLSGFISLFVLYGLGKQRHSGPHLPQFSKCWPI